MEEVIGQLESGAEFIAKKLKKARDLFLFFVPITIAAFITSLIMALYEQRESFIFFFILCTISTAVFCFYYGYRKHLLGKNFGYLLLFVGYAFAYSYIVRVFISSFVDHSSPGYVFKVITGIFIVILTLIGSVEFGYKKGKKTKSTSEIIDKLP